MVMDKGRNENSTKTMKWRNMHPICIQDCALKRLVKNTIVLCPKVWASIVCTCNMHPVCIQECAFEITQDHNSSLPKSVGLHCVYLS